MCFSDWHGQYHCSCDEIPVSYLFVPAPVTWFDLWVNSFLRVIEFQCWRIQHMFPKCRLVHHELNLFSRSAVDGSYEIIFAKDVSISLMDAIYCATVPSVDANCTEHQQNVFYLLSASRSVREDEKCKLRCVNFRTVSEPTRAFRLAFEATEFSDDWYRSAMGVIVKSLGTPQSTAENFGCTWEQLGAPAIGLAAPATSLGLPSTNLPAPATNLGAMETSLGAPQITVKQSGKYNIFFGNAAAVPGNCSYYLSSNDC